MIGERLDWFKLASHLRMSVKQCQKEVYPIEFRDWRTFFAIEVNSFHREDYYFAMLGAILLNRLNFSDKPTKPVDPAELILEFTTQAKKLEQGKRGEIKRKAQNQQEQHSPRINKVSILTQEEKTLRSKSAWMGFVGLNMDGTPMRDLKREIKNPPVNNEKK